MRAPASRTASSAMSSAARAPPSGRCHRRGPGGGLPHGARGARRLRPWPRREAGDRRPVQDRRAARGGADEIGEAAAKAAGKKPLLLSAVSGEGIEAALRVLTREIAAAGSADPTRSRPRRKRLGGRTLAAVRRSDLLPSSPDMNFDLNRLHRAKELITQSQKIKDCAMPQ